MVVFPQILRARLKILTEFTTLTKYTANTMCDSSLTMVSFLIALQQVEINYMPTSDELGKTGH